MIVKCLRRFVASSSVLAAAGAVLVIVTVLEFEAGGGVRGGGMVPVYNVLFWPNYKVIRIGPRMLHSTPHLTAQHNILDQDTRLLQNISNSSQQSGGWQSNIQTPKRSSYFILF